MIKLSKDSLLIAPRQVLIDHTLDQYAINEALSAQIQELKFQLDWLKRQMFGAKSERFINDDDVQTALELGITPTSYTTVVGETAPHTHVKTQKEISGHGRSSMPTHLPIVKKTVEPVEDVCGMVKIGEEVSWYYEMKPSSLYIVQTIRPTYKNPDTGSIITAELPPLPIEKGNAGPGFMAYVTIDKFVYHMPLDRQRRKFKSEYNVDISESWLCDLVKNVGFWIEPLVSEYKDGLFNAKYLCADETPIPVLVKDKKGKTHRGYFWVYYDPVNKIVVFDYSTSRSSAAPTEFLKKFRGILQVDGYGGYNEIIAANKLRRAACMDHVRRKFEQALGNDDTRARHAIDTMRNWYQVEAGAKENNLSVDERFALRVNKTVPSMKAFGNWLKEQLPNILPKSGIGQAVTYALDQWPFFEPFMTEPAVEISNIAVENSIRPVALGRKNYMFMGSHDAAKNAAMIYTLAATAAKHGIDPKEYLTSILTNFPAMKNLDIAKFLLPDWKPEIKNTSIES